MSGADQTRQLRVAADARAMIDQRIDTLFAPEDDALRAAREAPAAHDMPSISISPAQGRLLELLARSIGARRILEIGALAGYSGVWLARALPADGRLVSLEVSEKHAEVARASLASAGLSGRSEVRVAPAETSLAALVSEPPFDLVFIDANKDGYPVYLDWALKLARPGALIIADNTVRGGAPLAETLPADADDMVRGAWEYNHKVVSNPRLMAVALANDEGGMDGMTIALVTA